jgi:hypothetical protein
MLANLSPTISLAAAGILAAGLAVHVRAQARALAAFRVIGTSVAAFGGLTMLAAVVLAWPRPELLLAVGVANAMVLFALAVVSRIAPLYAAAIGAGALACVVATHLIGGTLPIENVSSHILLHALLTCRSGIVLTILAALTGIAGWQLLKSNRSEDGAVFLASAGACCVISALFAAFVGYVPAEFWIVTPAGDVLWAAPLLFVHGLALIAFAPRLRQPAAAVAGSALLWLGLVHGVAWNDFVRHALDAIGLLPARPVLCATLIHGVLAGLVALVAAGRGMLLTAAEFAGVFKSPRWEHLIAPLSLTAAAALAGALPFIVWAPATQLYWHASYAAWGAAICLALLLVWRHAAAFASLQAMVALAAGFLTAAFARDWLAAPSWRFDWRHIDAQLVVAALFAAAWSAFRRVSNRWPVIRQLVAGQELSVDQGLLALAAVAVPLLAIAGVWPGILAELGATFAAKDWALADWMESAGGRGDWLAVAAVAAALLTLLFAEGRFRDALGGLVAVLFAVPWLMAGWFAEPVAVASAARWGLALYVAGFCAVSLAAGRWLAQREHLLGQTASLAAQPFIAIWPFALGAAAILAITFAVVAQSLSGNALGGPAAGSWFDAIGRTLSFGIPLSVLVVANLAFSLAWRRAEMSILASLLFQLTANLAFLIHLSSSTAPSEPVRWVEWLQWNALALGLFGVVWSAVEWWKKRLDVRDSQLLADLPIERWGNLAQLFLCTLLVRSLAAWAAGGSHGNRVKRCMSPRSSAAGKATPPSALPRHFSSGARSGVCTTWRSASWPSP